MYAHIVVKIYYMIFFKHVIGFSNAPVGFVKITECPECFEKYYSHCNMNDIDRFLDYLEDGLNIHHKN